MTELYNSDLHKLYDLLLQWMSVVLAVIDIAKRDFED